MLNSVLTCENVMKSYGEGSQNIAVLQGVNLSISSGERIAIVGASGSGKSTLLNILGGLDTPDQGEVEVIGQAFSRCSEKMRGKLRNQHLGFVYQFHHLLPEFTAKENVAMPLLIAKETKKLAYEKATLFLDKVGLAARLDHKPAELSGGERQRVAIARALVNSPNCVLMDEPTGNLDSSNAKTIQRLMLDLSIDSKTSFIVVTHDENLASKLDKVYELCDGALTQRAEL